MFACCAQKKRIWSRPEKRPSNSLILCDLDGNYIIGYNRFELAHLEIPIITF